MSLLQELRAIVPARRLTRTEAFVLAERQATWLLQRTGITDAPVPSTMISRLPFVHVAIRTPMSSSGATRWIKPHWVVLLNGMEPVVRQRFSLAHELKHILDHDYARQVLGPTRSKSTNRSIEQLCDFFAASVLMPRTWVKSAFADGVQDVYDLAELFEVSPQAMQVRLLQLGLIDPYARCSGIDNVYLRSLPVSPLELAA